MLSKTILLATLLPLALACSSKKSGPSEVKIESLGISVTLPAGFEIKERRGSQWISKSAMYGARLEKRDAMPESLDVAVKGWIQGKTIDKGAEAGGFYAVIESEFPMDGGKTMKLPMVYVQMPAKDGSVLCSGQLQDGDDAKPLVKACQGIKPLE